MNPQEHFIPTNNQFKNHLQALADKKITLKQLESICFAFIAENNKKFQERPLPTEPIMIGEVSAADFLEVKKAWKYNCEKITAENNSNAEWLEKSEKFFLKNPDDYDTGLGLFVKYENYEKKPEVKAKVKPQESPIHVEIGQTEHDDNESVNPFIKEVKKVSVCPF